MGIKLIKTTPENLKSYAYYLELCNILRDRTYTCPFCGKHYVYVGAVFNHLEKVHKYYE